MKKVKNPRSGLSWSEITLVLIKKTIRLVLKFESGWHCCFRRWADLCSCRSVVPFSLPQLPLASDTDCLFPTSLPPCLPLWHSLGSQENVSWLLQPWLCVGLHGWCLAQFPLHVLGGVGMPQAGAVGKSFVIAFPDVCVTMVVLPLLQLCPSVVHTLSWILSTDRWPTGVAVKNKPCYGEDRWILQLS